MDFVVRHAEKQIRTALADTRVVAIVGPRQSGKTTLARRISADDGRAFATLDDAQLRRFAQSDPTGFLRGMRSATIDEIQRAPDLVLEIKKAVDQDRRPGRFLITGSVDLFRHPVSPDSMAGRVETVELFPFSQAEIANSGAPAFLDRAFAGEFPSFEDIGPTDDLTRRVLSGGFPEALSRAGPERRNSWLRNYARMLTERDASDLSSISKTAELTRLIEYAAAFSGQLLNLSRLASPLGVDGKTVDRWLTLFEQLFLIRRVHAWNRSDTRRLIRAPKLQFLDSGLLAALKRADQAEIVRDRGKLGTLLECFVHSELAKAAGLSEETTHVSHYRDKDRVEVDLVLERPPDRVVGIEIKAGATARPEDFKGLKRLKDAVGEGFSCGILIHDGERIQRVAPKLFAMPVKMLWLT